MRKGLKILIIADAWISLALGMIGPIYAIFVERIGGDILDAGWAYFVFTITSGVVLYLISKWENRIIHKEKLVVWGYAITAVGCLFYYFTETQTVLLITQAILGIGIAVVTPAFDAIYSHLVKTEKEASDWGAWEAMGYIVAAIAAIAGSYIASTFGFKILFIIMFFAAIFGVIASFRLLKGEKYLYES